MNHSERKHSWLSPSGLKPIVDGCVAKPYLEKDFPERPAGAAAERGTKIHELAEKMLKGTLFNVSAYDEGMVEVANGYVDYVKSILLTDANHQLFTELKVNVLTDCDIAGTADTLIFFPSTGVLHIVDLKTGRYPVNVKENVQLIAYLAGFIKDNCSTVSITELVFHIFQPGNPQPPWVIPANTFFETWVDPIEKKIWQSYHIYKEILELDYDNHTAINDGCIFCRAKSICPTFKEHLAKETLVLLDDYPVTIPRVADLTVEQKVRIFQAKKLIETYLSEIEATLKEDLESGVDVPGLMITAGKTVRKWADDKDYVAKELAGLGVDPYRTDLITITEAEKRLGKRKKLLPEEVFTTTQQADRIVVKEMKHLELLEDI